MQRFGGVYELFDVGDYVARIDDFIAMFTLIARDVPDDNQHVAEVGNTRCFTFDGIAAATGAFHSFYLFAVKFIELF